MYDLFVTSKKQDYSSSNSTYLKRKPLNQTFSLQEPKTKTKTHTKDKSKTKTKTQDTRQKAKDKNKR